MWWSNQWPPKQYICFNTYWTRWRGVNHVPFNFISQRPISFLRILISRPKLSTKWEPYLCLRLVCHTHTHWIAVASLLWPMKIKEPIFVGPLLMPQLLWWFTSLLILNFQGRIEGSHLQCICWAYTILILRGGLGSILRWIQASMRLV